MLHTHTYMNTREKNTVCGNRRGSCTRAFLLTRPSVPTAQLWGVERQHSVMLNRTVNAPCRTEEITLCVCVWLCQTCVLLCLHVAINTQFFQWLVFLQLEDALDWPSDQNQGSSMWPGSSNNQFWPGDSHHYRHHHQYTHFPRKNQANINHFNHTGPLNSSINCNVCWPFFIDNNPQPSHPIWQGENSQGGMWGNTSATSGPSAPGWNNPASAAQGNLVRLYG